MKLQTAIGWCASVLVTVAMAIGFLFLTFETAADSSKMQQYFDGRLDKLENKIDKILDQTK